MFLAFDDSPLSTHEGPPSSITQFLVPLLALTLFAATGLLGFGFGVRALLEMRASSGQKRGLFRVMFGALAWPVVLVFQLSGFLFRILFDLVGSNNDGLFAAAAIVVGLAASTFLIRRVDRWVKGGTATKDQEGTGAGDGCRVPKPRTCFLPKHSGSRGIRHGAIQPALGHPHRSQPRADRRVCGDQRVGERFKNARTGAPT